MQNKLIVDYMRKHGSITSREAFQALGITRLSARIFELKELGLNVQAERETSYNRYNIKTRYNRYYLVEGASE